VTDVLMVRSAAFVCKNIEYTGSGLPYSYIDLASFSLLDIPSLVILPIYSDKLMVFLLALSYPDV
jgi:hypothetical protein